MAGRRDNPKTILVVCGCTAENHREELNDLDIDILIGNKDKSKIVEIVEDETNIPEDAVSVVIEGVKIFIPLDELVDFTKELERLNKEKAKLEGEIKRVNGKLSNQGFLAKAPESLVNEEKAKKAKFEEMMNSVLERIANIEAKMN